MQLLKTSNFFNFHVEAFTQRSRKAGLKFRKAYPAAGQGKAKEKTLQ
jgi:hypothetical protein